MGLGKAGMPGLSFFFGWGAGLTAGFARFFLNRFFFFRSKGSNESLFMNDVVYTCVSLQIGFGLIMQLSFVCWRGLCK